MKTRRIPLCLASVLLLPGVVLLAACQQVSTQDIQGFLQAMEGKEAIITLPDGNTIRVTVDDAQAIAQAGSLVGDRVDVKVRVSGDKRELVTVKHLGDDQHFTGAIETIGKDAWVIGGKTFKVDAATEFDGGLVKGVTARVEFVAQQDGAMLATKIETDEEAERIAGAIECISGSQVKIAGKTFQLTPGTRIDTGLTAGTPARVRFATQADGTLVAIRVERSQDDEHFAGVIEVMGKDVWKIGGREFVVNQATRLDNGLAAGVKARVKFIQMSDAKMVATEIETDEAPQRFSGAVESVSNTAWVVAGQTFKVNETTRMEKDVKQGDRVEVRFMALPDGSRLASRVKSDRSGRRGGGEEDQKGRGNDDRGNSGSSGRGDGVRGVEDQKLTAAIESIAADKAVIGGQTFKIDKNTKLDTGLDKGVKATVEFTIQPDGTKLAKEIETGDSSSSGRSR